MQEYTDRHKTTKACANCRRLKVKCVRTDPTDFASPCKRCIKTHKECVQVPVKRRRGLLYLSNGAARASSSISTPTLSVESSPVSPTGYTRMTPTFPNIEVADTPHDSKPFLNQNEIKDESTPRLIIPQPHNNYISQRRSSSINVLTARNQMMRAWDALMRRDRARIECLDQMTLRSVARYENNAIAQGIISIDDAESSLQLYRDVFAPRFPAVALPDEPIEKIMRDTPILFHCAIAIVSRMLQDSLAVQRSLALRILVHESLLTEIVVRGDRKLEVLQGLVLMLYWYNEVEFSHRQQTSVLAGIAITVGYDLGIGGGQIVGLTRAPIFDQIVSSQATVAPGNKQVRQAWLAVYSMNFQPQIANRRPVLDIWNKYTAESTQELYQQPKVVAPKPSYIPLWMLAEATELFELIYAKFYKKDNEVTLPDMNDQSVQKSLAEMASKIDQLYEKCQPYVSSAMRMLTMSLKICLYQGIIYAPYSEPIGRSPFTNFSLNLYASALDSQAIGYFSKIYNCAAEVLKIFINDFDYNEIAVMISPLYGMVVLVSSVLLKCRALSLLNPYFAEAADIQEGTLQTITDVIEIVNGVTERFTGNNSAASVVFTLRLLVCHHDATVYFLLYELGMKPIAPRELKPYKGPQGYPVAKEGEPQDSHINSPHLDQRDREDTYSNGAMQTPQQDAPTFLNLDPFTFTSVDPIQPPGLTDSQSWQLGEDFWRDIIPADFLMADF